MAKYVGMERQEITQESLGMSESDGYVADPIWKSPEGHPYYDYIADTQCSIPARSAKQILASLGI